MTNIALIVAYLTTSHKGIYDQRMLLVRILTYVVITCYIIPKYCNQNLYSPYGREENKQIQVVPTNKRKTAIKQRFQ